MKNILIAGGAGFIGSHLTDYLVNEGHKVVVVDNHISSNSYRNPQVNYLNQWAEKLDVKDLFDECYYLASPAAPAIYQKYPLETISANTSGLVAAMVTAKRVVYASTSEIYGSPLEHPQKETYWGNVNTLGPRSCYDNSKRLGETLCYEYAKLGANITIARIFNTYGPRMNPNDGRVVVNFIEQIKTNGPLTVYGDGLQTRSFCYVKDTVLGLIALMEKGKKGEAYNIGNPEEFTILGLIETLKSLTQYEGAVEFRDLPQDDPPRRCPDITKATTELGWRPKVTLREGLRLMLESLDKTRQK